MEHLHIRLLGLVKSWSYLTAWPILQQEYSLWFSRFQDFQSLCCEIRPSGDQLVALVTIPPQQLPAKTFLVL